MILTNEKTLAEKAPYFTTQAKDDPVRYIHDETGYNFRLTNIQTAMGVAQLEKLLVFLKCKCEIYSTYQTAIENIDGITLAGVPDYANHHHWLNLVQIDIEIYGDDREALMQRLEENSIQTRSVWGLNHLRKPYEFFTA